jgi:cation diffusion facilitator CzcD-associated flavoprotein CzcO
MEKYEQERNKRTREEGVAQYIDLRKSEKYKHFVEDPWIDAGTPIRIPVPDGGRSKVLVLGAGFGGILFAVRCIQAGIDRKDIVIVDMAGGFGGTWYWNRYPGLMCDVESHIYLPLIEEMGYMPKRKYVSGSEIREYVESLCSKYGLHDRAMFQSSVKSVAWNESNNEWDVKIAAKPKGGEESDHTLHANFVTLAPGKTRLRESN